MVVGDGNPTRWDRETRRLGIGERVQFLGERGDVADLCRAADLFVFPSRAEGCPNAILEAMACGLPVVATDIAGNREVLGEDGKAGHLVPVESPTVLAEAVAHLAGSSVLRHEMGAAARIKMRDRYDIRRVVKQYLSLYDELTS
jgi:glycosyltransferase involved in cell wall biosynthesis